MTQGALHFESTLGTQGFDSGISRIQNGIRSASNTAKSEASSMDDAFKKVGLAIGGYFTAQSLMGFTRELINVRGEFQKTEIAFTTMLGGADKAKVLMGEMVDLAAKTPFGLQEVSAGAKQLLAFQVPANQVVDVLTRMGNIASGLGVPLSRINLVYGQVRAKGRLMGDDLRQFTEAGIPMIAELANKFKVSESAITEMVSAGKVGFKDVEEVLYSLTDEGGMFFNLMEKQSASLSGKIANLGDAWEQMLNKIGTQQQDNIAGGIDEIIYLVENYEKLIELIKGLVVVYGSYRAALIVYSVAVQVAAAREAGFTVAMMRRLTVTALVDKATKALNATMLMNPYALATALIVGLTYAIIKMSTQTSYAEAAQDSLNKKLQEGKESIVEQKSKIESLVLAIKSENTSNENREKLLKRLKTLSNGRLNQLTVEAIMTGKATSAIDAYVNALDREARAKAYQDQLTENYKRINEIDNRKGSTFGERVASTFDAATYQDENGNTTMSSVFKGLTTLSVDTIKSNELKEKKALMEQNETIKAQIKKNGGDLVSTEQEVAKVQEAVQKNITEKNKRDLAEVFAAGSIADLEQRISLWNEALNKAGSGENIQVLTKNKFGDTVKTGKTVDVSKALSELDRLEKAKKEREKLLSNQTFEEQIQELERQWSVKNQVAEKYGKEYAEKAYPNLKGSYFDDVKKQFEDLNTQMNEGLTISDEQLNKWVKLNSILNELGGEESRSEKVKKDLKDIKEAATSTYDYLERVREEQKKYEGDNSFEGLNIKKFLKDEEEGALDSIKSTYLTFLQEHQTFEDQKTTITKKYADLRQQIMGDDKLSPEKKNEALKAANAAEGQELSSAFLNGMRQNPEWAKAFEDMGNVSLSQLKKLREMLSRELDNLMQSGKGSPTELKALADTIKDIDGAILSRNPFKVLSDAIKNLGNEADQTKTKIEKIKDVAKGVMASADLINSGISTGVGILEDLGVQFSDGAKDVIADVQTTLGGVSDLASGIISMNPASILKGIGGIIKGLSGLFSKDKKKERNIKAWAAEVENLKNQYENLQRAVEKALGEDTYKNQQAVINNLRQQQAALQKMINEEKGKKKSDNGKIQEWQNQINTINNQIQDIYDNMAQQISGTNAKDMASTLADALIEAYAKGEDAATAYGKVADDVMKNAVKNALKMQLLEGPMQNVIKQLIKNMGFNDDGTGSFDGLTEDERNQIRTMMQSASQNYMDALGAYEDLFGSAAGLNSSLEGAVKGVSEETASIIAGQLNAIRNNQGQMMVVSQESIEVFRSSYIQLVQIEQNTRYLKYIYNSLSGNEGDPWRAAGIRLT